MLDNIQNVPFGFWGVVIVLVFGSILAFGQRRSALGLPLLAVLGTVGAWYVVDPIYNDYREYSRSFSETALDAAWGQVILFLISFLILSRIVFTFFNRRFQGQSSQLMQMIRTGPVTPAIQRDIGRVLFACVLVWFTLSVVAVFRLKFEAVYYFFPFLGYKAEPWGRGRIGGGFDFLLSFANYLQLFVASAFGVVAALARNGVLRCVAIAGCVVTWPYYIFDRTRNPMLAITLPAVMTWVFIRLRGGLLTKLAVMSGVFLVLNGWFKFVLENRAENQIAMAFHEKGFHTETDVQHLGLNMFEELCWINTFLQNGNYEPNWGQRYFAEMVNPIPRTLWPNKPLIGIDYAILRGQAYRNNVAEDGSAGVYATISTGMIGQGVTNFGPLLGPVAAALLMSFWVVLLARMDLQGQRGGRLPIYALGLVLTFNLGRDITLITIYPFIFGNIVVWWFERLAPRNNPPEKDVKNISADANPFYKRIATDSRLAGNISS